MHFFNAEKKNVEKLFLPNTNFHFLRHEFSGSWLVTNLAHMDASHYCIKLHFMRPKLAGCVPDSGTVIMDVMYDGIMNYIKNKDLVNIYESAIR